jgi:N-acetylneuraminic acid mutarotase
VGKHDTLLLVLVFLAASFIIAAKAVSASSPNSWTSKAPMPTARAFFGVAVVEGKIYAIGGADGVNEVYDPANDTWATRKPMPNPRTGFAIAAYESKIYIMGGYANGRTALNDVYDTRTDAWETKTPMPTGRSQVQASVVNGKIYVIGGILDNGEILRQNEVYEPAADAWTVKSPIPYGVYSHSSAVVDNKIYVISGQSASPGHSGPDKGPLNQIYNPETDTWTLGAAPPLPAHRSGAVVTSGVLAPKRIYVIGGEVGFMEATNINQVYDPQTDTWSMGAPMPTARQGLSVAIVNDVIYALGGSYPADDYSTTASSEPKKQYTMLANAQVTPVNFVPQKQCAVNEQYTPLGYGNTPIDTVTVPTANATVPTDKTPAPTDNVTPRLSIMSPANKTYNTASIPLTFTVNEAVTWIRYSLDDQDNVTIHGNAMLTELSEGAHKLSVFAADVLGNVGSEEVHFSVAQETKPEPQPSEPFPAATVAAASFVSAAAVGAGLLLYFAKVKRKTGIS